MNIELNEDIIEVLQRNNVRFIGNPDDRVILTLERLHQLLDDVYEIGELNGYSTGFHEAEDV